MEQNWSFIYLFGAGLILILVFLKTGWWVNPISGVWQEILLESPVVLQRKVRKALSSGSTEGKGLCSFLQKQPVPLAVMGKAVLVGACPSRRYVRNVVCCLVLFGTVCVQELVLLPGDKNSFLSKLIKLLRTSLGGCGALPGCPGHHKLLLSAGWVLQRPEFLQRHRTSHDKTLAAL